MQEKERDRERKREREERERERGRTTISRTELTPIDQAGRIVHDTPRKRSVTEIQGYCSSRHDERHIVAGGRKDERG